MTPENTPHINLESVWLPAQHSTIASQVDSAWWVVMAMSVGFFLILMGMMFYFVIRYRRRSEYEITSDIDHSNKLELLWTVIPTILVIALFFVGFKGYLYASVPPRDAYEIQVVAQKWSWQFTYPNGVSSNELTVPEDRPVKMIMSSQDVIHSFYVPEFRVKRDVIPGLYTTVWFEATEPTETGLFCAEYCGGGGDGHQGTGHSAMWTRVHVVTGPDFDNWLQKQEDLANNLPPAELGKKLYTDKGCIGCHTLDGAKGNGPTFKGLFGRDEQMSDGKSIHVDENYIRESILQSQAKLVAGFPPIMPVFEGQLRDKDVTGLIEFIKTVK
jgi:cytochrome c oxidase subunit II